MHDVTRPRSIAGHGTRANAARRLFRLTVIALAVVGLLVPATAASAQRPEVREAVSTFEYSRNMHPMGYSERIPIETPDFFSLGDINSDLAFWGNYAIQGHYTGFRIVDVSSPANPRVVTDYDECGVSRQSTTGQQGDVIVWDGVIIRSWDGPAGGECGDLPGVSGLHVFDASDFSDPEPVGYIDLRCGSHTASVLPDADNDRLLVYSSPASGTDAAGQTCPGIDIVEVDLNDLTSVTHIREVDANQMCHDTAIILGDAMLAACAGHQGPPWGGGGALEPEWTGVSVFSMHPDDGGSIEDPVLLHQTMTPGIGIGHSAAFTWDGEIIAIGHEPGGGGQARCQADQDPDNHTIYFMASRTGELVGEWELERKQGPTENCTIHNYNIVPTDKAYVLVSGNYQAGIAVVDFSDPANAHMIAYADPEPLDPDTLVLGGSWSAYWYNGRIYDSDIRRGLFIWNLSDPRMGGAMKLPYLNPQTQEFTIERSPAFGRVGQGRTLRN